MIDGSIANNKKISRSKLLDTLRQFEPGALIAMEACSTLHFWGRTFRTMGNNVRLIPVQHVKAFVRSQKNDANDALAMCEKHAARASTLFRSKPRSSRISKRCAILVN